MEHIFAHRSGQGIYENCKFAKGVEIFDTPKMYDSLIYGGQTFDSPNIVNSSLASYCRINGRPRIRDSHVSGTAQIYGMPQIYNSVIAGNALIGKDVGIHFSEILGNARILDKARVIDAVITGNAVVCESANVWGKHESPLEIGGYTYISEGTWLRPPLVLETDFGFAIVESINRNVHIGCITNTVEKFLSGAGDRYGHLLGLDKSQVDMLRYGVQYMKDMKDRPDYDMNI